MWASSAQKAVYLLALYVWWNVCGSYFGPVVTSVPVPEPVTVEPPAVVSATAPARQRAQEATPAAVTSDALPVQAPTEASSAASTPSCPPNRRPYHTLLTGQGTFYNQWQARIMYFHWKKQAAAGGACTEMTGFTRICASKDGLPDGVEKYIPSVFLPQLTTEVLAKYGHFGVLNRPHSVVEFFKNPENRKRIKERYVYVAETDHVLMQPMPNLATETEAAAHAFGYMHASSHHQKVVDLCVKGVSWRDLQPVGPSPLIIKLDDLERVAQRWLDYSYILRADPFPKNIIQDWVLEMWGYAIAAASLGIRHKIIPSFQIEPNAYAHTSEDFYKRSYIFHYTYGIEYRLDGRPQGFNTIGEWSMDKRHYGGAYPPPNLEKPPEAANPSSKWLWRAWNEAMANEPEWPATNAMGTDGWRRESISASEIQKCALCKSVLGTEWTWAGIRKMVFQDAGVLKTPWGEGKWGIAARPKGMPECFGEGRQCLFVDFSSAAHHVSFELPNRFKSLRVGDGEIVVGKRLVDGVEA